MNSSISGWLTLLCAICWAGIAEARKNNVSAADDLRLSYLPYYSFGQGIGITSPDSLYQMNIRFRMQNRITYQEKDQLTSIDGQIRRLRLRFDGYVGDPRFQYTMQLSFAPGDVGSVEDGKNLNIIRDAIVFYRPNQRWSFGFGQTKLPGNRQRVNSSGGLQFTDRSINNARFNIDRDFGLQVHQTNMFQDRFSWNLKGAISMGEGRNWTTNNDNSLAYTGKVELYPFGAFTKNGDYFEGDLMREVTPKLMFSAVFHQNNQAKRTQGQQGEDLFQPRTMQSIFLDVIFKYRGLAGMASYMRRDARDPVTVQPGNPGNVRYVYAGAGTDIQASYLFKNNIETIARYSTQQAHAAIHIYAPHTRQYSFGLTKYIWEHAFKLQSEFTFQQEKYYSGISKDSWYLRFQVEIGI